MKLLNASIPAAIFFVYATVVSLASDPPKVTPTDDIKVKLEAAEQDAAFLKLEKLVLQEQLITIQLDKVRDQKNEAYAEVCKKAGMPADTKVCGVDWEKRKAIKVEAAKPAAKE